MIAFLLGAHVVMCVALGLVGERLGRRVFWLAAIPPAITTVWAITPVGRRPSELR